MWSVAEIKQRLLDERADIREYAVDYLADCRAADADIIPLILEGFRRYGTDNAHRMLLQAFHFTVTADAVAPLIALLSEVKTFDARKAVGYVLAQMPPESFAEYEDELRCSSLDVDVLRRLRVQKDLLELKLSGEEHFKELRMLAEICDKSEGWPKEVELGAHEILIRQLTAQSTPSEDEVVQLLAAYGENAGDWMELFLIKLAGARRIQAAIPELTRRLHSDSIVLLEECLSALTAINDVSTIELLTKDWAEGSWTFKNFANGILSRSKTRESEAALLSVLKTEEDNSVCTMICMALCRIGSAAGIEATLEMIERGYTDSLCRLEHEILPAATLLEIDLPQAGEWLADLEASRQRDASKIRRIDEGHSRPGPRPTLSEPALSERRETVTTTIRYEAAQVGRNGQCPCGSGKKFKKCCGH